MPKCEYNTHTSLTNASHILGQPSQRIRHAKTTTRTIYNDLFRISAEKFRVDIGLESTRFVLGNTSQYRIEQYRIEQYRLFVRTIRMRPASVCRVRSVECLLICFHNIYLDIWNSFGQVWLQMV